MRQGLGRDHAALFAGAADQAAAPGRRARVWRIRGNRMGRSARHRRRPPQEHPRHRPQKARLFHRARPEPGADRMVGQPVRHAQSRRPWRVLFGQHGGRRALHHRRLILGIRRTGLGTHRIFHDVRRRGGSRFQPDQDGPVDAEGARREIRVGQPGQDRLFRHCRRMGRGASGQRRRVRAGADPRIAARRQDRSRLPGALHQRAVAGDPRPGCGR